MLLAVEVVCATIGDSGCDGSDSCRSVVWILPYTISSEELEGVSVSY